MKSVVFALIVLAASYGQISLKKAVTAHEAFELGIIINPHFLIGVALYSFCSLAWLWVLKSTPLSQAYPVLALTFVTVPLLSYFFFSDKISFLTVLGSLMILAGVLIVTREF